MVCIVGMQFKFNNSVAASAYPRGEYAAHVFYLKPILNFTMVNASLNRDNKRIIISIFYLITISNRLNQER